MITECYLCRSVDSSVLPGEVRDRSDIGIRKCNDCGLVFLDRRDHLGEDYYRQEYSEENHPGMDHDSFLQETAVDDERRFRQILPHIKDRKYLDIGCGGGGVLLRARSECRLASGVEPQIVWRQALMANGLEIFQDISEIPEKKFEIISLFHVLEHIKDPRTFLRQVNRAATASGKLIIEVPNAEDALLTLYENEAFSKYTYWSAHLYLYNIRTLGMLLTQTGFPKWQIEQFQRYPLSNHLMWLSQGRPGGHKEWSFLDSAELNREYSHKLAELGKCDTLIAYVETY